MKRRNRKSQAQKDAEALLQLENKGPLIKRGQLQQKIEEEGMFFREDIEKAEKRAKESPHAGISSRSYFDRLRKFQKRQIDTFMDPNLVEKEIFFGTDPKGPQPVHPFLRKMVSIQSTAFKQAVHLVTNAILKAKQNHQMVAHLQCCDIFWIGKPPKCSTHCFNDTFRRYMDLRNIPKAYYNPQFLPGFVQEEAEVQTANPFLAEDVPVEIEEPLKEDELEKEEEKFLDFGEILTRLKEKEELMSSLPTAATAVVDEDGDLIADRLAPKIECIWDDIDSDGEEVVLGYVKLT